MNDLNTPEFVHLHVHSEFSLSDSLLKVKQLVGASAGQGAPAVALTDVGNLFALVKFYETCLSHGIKPLLGAELKVAEGDPQEVPGERVVLLAMNDRGYANLIKLVSASFTSVALRGVVPDELVFAHNEGLIALSGGVRGHLWHLASNTDHAPLLRRATLWQRHFGDRYYLELTRTGRPAEEDVLRRLVRVAQETGLGVVACNDVCFAESDDFEAHETRVCIHAGRALDDPRRQREYSDQQYLRTPAEMADLFADLPQALSNTGEIAKRCSVSVHLGTYYLPDYPIPEFDRAGGAGRAPTDARSAGPECVTRRLCRAT